MDQTRVCIVCFDALPSGSDSMPLDANETTQLVLGAIDSAQGSDLLLVDDDDKEENTRISSNNATHTAQNHVSLHDGCPSSGFNSASSSSGFKSASSCTDSKSVSSRTASSDITRYSHVGNSPMCRQKHLMCENCIVEFASNPVNASCPACRAPLTPLFQLIHRLQVERKRADFMAAQQQQVRDIADEFADRVARVMCCQEEKSRSNHRPVEKQQQQQHQPRHHNDKNDDKMRICSISNDFTENIRYKTRTPDAHEMLCMLRAQR